MKVPEGIKVYSGRHKYKAGEELPAHLSKALEKKLNKQIPKGSTFTDKDSDK